MYGEWTMECRSSCLSNHRYRTL